MIKNILNSYDRQKTDNSDDSIFYSQPRFVYHLDENFRSRLTELYAKEIAPNSIVLDLMSSWVSHLPQLSFEKVIGHGLNIQELQKNKRLNSFWVQDLNKKQILPLEDSSVDYCLIVAGWQYLQYPEAVSNELYRVIRPKGRLIISFSNRAFWIKSPNIWVKSTEQERIKYIKDVLVTSSWNIDTVISDNLSKKTLLNLIKFPSDPFYSLIASKS